MKRKSNSFLRICLGIVLLLSTTVSGSANALMPPEGGGSTGGGNAGLTRSCLISLMGDSFGPAPVARALVNYDDMVSCGITDEAADCALEIARGSFESVDNLMMDCRIID